MRMLNRNKQTFRYRLCTGTTVPVVDPDGYETGEQMPVYSAVFTGRANIAPATGEADERAFGTSADYDRIICANTDFGMDENSMLWVDDLDAEHPDYVVKRIARSINGVRIAIAKVNTNGHND